MAVTGLYFELFPHNKNSCYQALTCAGAAGKNHTFSLFREIQEKRKEGLTMFNSGFYNYIFLVVLLILSATLVMIYLQRLKRYLKPSTLRRVTTSPTSFWTIPDSKRSTAVYKLIDDREADAKYQQYRL